MRRGTRMISIAAGTTLALLALGATAAAGGSNRADARQQGQLQQRAALDRIFVIMLENHSKSSVIDDKNAPYLTHLAHSYAMADRYFGVTHPSMPNYMAAIAGDTFGIQDDDDQNVVHLDRRNLVDQLEAAHIPWGAYMQSLPANKRARFGPTLPDGTQAELYAKKHNPFVLFDDIKNNPARMARVRGFGRLGHDLNSPGAPRFVWISPNQCSDMHGGIFEPIAGHPNTPCPFGSAKDDPNDASLKHKADMFVKRAVGIIRSARAWTQHSAIVIVTDENDFTGNEETGGWESAAGCCDSPYVPKGDPRISPDWPGGLYGGGLIPAIVVSASGGRHVVDHTKYNHYSLLAAIENNWHLGHLGHSGDVAGGVVPMRLLTDNTARR